MSPATVTRVYSGKKRGHLTIIRNEQYVRGLAEARYTAEETAAKPDRELALWLLAAVSGLALGLWLLEVLQ